MRLKPFDPSRIRVGSGGGGGFPGGAGGGVGCGAIVIALIGALVLGIDPGTTLGTLDAVQQTQGGGSAGRVATNAQTVTERCTVNQYATEACNALDSLNLTWEPLFEKANIPFQQPFVEFYEGGIRSGCGTASVGSGPFYCPADHGIYLATSFYDVLQRQLGASGDFARYYVMAHEYGHHVQNLIGTADQVRSIQGQNPRAANQLQVRMELQADCYAGVWAGKNRNLIEPGDMEEGMNAAAAIGDDRLTGGRVSAENFTHGTSQQRMEWLNRGLQTADEDQCDTFADLRR